MQSRNLKATESNEKVPGETVDRRVIDHGQNFVKLPVPDAVERNDEQVWALWDAAASSIQLRALLDARASKK
jgi:hypothetical protein